MEGGWRNFEVVQDGKRRRIFRLMVWVSRFPRWAAPRIIARRGRLSRQEMNYAIEERNFASPSNLPPVPPSEFLNRMRRSLGWCQKLSSSLCSDVTPLSVCHSSYPTHLTLPDLLWSYSQSNLVPEVWKRPQRRTLPPAIPFSITSTLFDFTNLARINALCLVSPVPLDRITCSIFT